MLLTAKRLAGGSANKLTLSRGPRQCVGPTHSLALQQSLSHDKCQAAPAPLPRPARQSAVSDLQRYFLTEQVLLLLLGRKVVRSTARGRKGLSPWSARGRGKRLGHVDDYSRQGSHGIGRRYMSTALGELHHQPRSYGGAPSSALSNACPMSERSRSRAAVKPHTPPKCQGKAGARIALAPKTTGRRSQGRSVRRCCFHQKVASSAFSFNSLALATSIVRSSHSRL